MIKQVSENLYCCMDTCNVYIVKNGDRAVLIDFGSGQALDALDALGIIYVDAVLVTHHHRDQVQGLGLAAERQIPIFSPHTEQDLIARVDQMWQSREISYNYNNRQDRFSVLESVPISGTLKDYARITLAGYDFLVLPTPGHTPGSISLLLDLDGQKVAFTGDLLYAAGKVWSLAATQWSYNGGEGIPFNILSLFSLMEQKSQWLLPSHGQPVNADAAILPTIENLMKLLQFRGHNPRLLQLRDEPYQKLTDHLLFNRTSMSNGYVLLSRSGKALMIDFGYDFMAGVAAGVDRSARRPWLYTVPDLMKSFGVQSIDACLPTHYHDDHVAGFNLLRDVYGAKVMCPESFADILENPYAYDIPCLWHDPILVDERLPLETPIQWEEYELVLHALSGHTCYSVAIECVVDSKKVLFGGDQYAGEDGLLCNYVYKNMFGHKDFIRSAALYRRVKPDLILTGHWNRFVWDDSYFEAIQERGKQLAEIHDSLLPYKDYKTLSSDFCAVFKPYRMISYPGETVTLMVEAANPLHEDGLMKAALVLPEGFDCQKPEAFCEAKAQSKVCFYFSVTASHEPVYRARVGCDITVNQQQLGQQAEMLLTVVDDRPPQDIYKKNRGFV